MRSVEKLFADRVRINVAWLIALRWVAILGQLITILAVTHWLRVDLPVFALMMIVGFTTATNVGLLVARQRLGGDRGTSSVAAGREILLGSIMAVDILMLTLMLAFTGGPYNPFAIFYLVNIALAAVLLPPSWSWFVLLLALVCHGSLYALYWPWGNSVLSIGGKESSVPAPPAWPSAWPGSAVMTVPRGIYLAGQFVATAIAAMTMVYFVTRLTTKLALLDEEMQESRQSKARNEKLEGLATLAAGAAHELSTPLSTIAVVAKELERHLKSSGVAVPEKAHGDLKLIRSELARCRGILDQMAVNAGQAMGEPLVPIDPRELASAALAMLRTPERVRPALTTRPQLDPVLGPSQTLAQVLRGLLQNALDASPPEATIDLIVRDDPDALQIEVRDQGEGMPYEVLTRLGEPFFTTKEPGRGMGLGLFLARSVIERLGGTLVLRSVPGRGTLATVSLPRARR